MERMSVTCKKCGRSQWVPATLSHIKGTEEWKEGIVKTKKGNEQYGMREYQEPFHCENCGKVLNTNDLD